MMNNISEPNDDGDAWSILNGHYGCSRGGMIYPKDRFRPETPAETRAINYLMSEWDYGWRDFNPDE